MEKLFKEMESLFKRNIWNITKDSFFELNEITLKNLSEFVFISIGRDDDYVFDKNEPTYFYGVPVKVNENLPDNQLKLNIKLQYNGNNCYESSGR